MENKETKNILHAPVKDPALYATKIDPEVAKKLAQSAQKVFGGMKATVDAEAARKWEAGFVQYKPTAEEDDAV